MSVDFPSIWLELKEDNCKSTIMVGFYREWTHDGDSSEAGQIERIKKFSTQIEMACETNCNLILLSICAIHAIFH